MDASVVAGCGMFFTTQRKTDAKSVISHKEPQSRDDGSGLYLRFVLSALQVSVHGVRVGTSNVSRCSNLIKYPSRA